MKKCGQGARKPGGGARTAHVEPWKGERDAFKERSDVESGWSVRREEGRFGCRGYPSHDLGGCIKTFRVLLL